jgi:hypothetical protein
MKHFYAFLLFFLTGMVNASAQKKTISGSLIDTFNNDKIESATVTLIRASDSILLGFTHSDQEGAFSLKVAEASKYIILISYPGFADYTDVFTSDAAPTIALGKIVLFTRENLLSEFVVRQKTGAILIKGDTTEYAADSFKVDANANVEALLKKLPGLQVDKNGQITAQGEKVQKILVDGEEFFSDDPAVVNRNLQAKTIDKVQIFDKKSENAAFTGIDDGQRTKTINLQLKDKYKKGYFGKLATGGGDNGFFENQGMFNLFRGKQKFSVFGIAANTGRIGLSYEDNNKFGSGGQSFSNEESGEFFTFAASDDDGGWDGNYNGQGLPKAWTAGAHFSDKWNKDKNHVNFNYKFSRRVVEAVNNTLTQYSLPDSVYYSDQRNNSFSTSDRHTLSGMYEWTIDSSSTLKLNASGAQMNKSNVSDFNTASKGAQGGIMNESARQSNNDGLNKNVTADLVWKKKFKKKGRTMLLDASFNQSYNNNNGYLHASNTFYSEGIMDSVTNINQLKKNESQTTSMTANATYTEPISKKGFLELKYKFNTQNNFSRQLSFNKNGAGQFVDLDSLYSTDYNFDVQTHRAGASLRWVYEKLNFSFGAGVSNTRFVQTDNLFGSDKTRLFNNFFPSASVNYKFTKQSSLNVNYNGNTQQPSIDQLQPIRQNTDPLNISIGNPNLRQEFDHNISMRYNSYKVLQGTYYYLGGGATFVNHDISRSESIISSGIRTYQYINVDGNYNSYLYAGAGFKIKKWDLDLGINSSANQGRVNNLVNNFKNRNDNNSYSLGLRFGYEKEKKFTVSFNPSVAYNQNFSSINQQNTAFWSTTQELNTTYYLPKKFELNLDISWSVRQRTVTFDQHNNVFLMNAYLAKKIGKNDAFEVRGSVFDIFNQNLGFSRYGQGNTVTQSSYNTIRRYALISVIWNFTKAPKESQAAEGIDIMEITK